MSTNNKEKAFDNKLVRQANGLRDRPQGRSFDLAMFGYGTPIGSHWSPFDAYYVDLTSKFPYNPAKAKELLAQAATPTGSRPPIKLPRSTLLEESRAR